jgi:hypothetical protein
MHSPSSKPRLFNLTLEMIEMTINFNTRIKQVVIDYLFYDSRTIADNGQGLEWSRMKILCRLESFLFSEGSPSPLILKRIEVNRVHMPNWNMVN